MAKIIKKNDPFVCEECDTKVEPAPSGCSRNHCPICLWCKHVDYKLPGDRKSTCLGMMKPVDVMNDKKKGEMLLHVCQKCGLNMRNRIAVDDCRDEMVKVCERKTK
jgi:hypothetical protein